MNNIENNKNLQNNWELSLESQLLILQQCQNTNNIKTCSICDKFLSCDIRKKYVHAVYKSMNKDDSGGFEF